MIYRKTLNLRPFILVFATHVSIFLFRVTDSITTTHIINDILLYAYTLVINLDPLIFDTPFPSFIEMLLTLF
jgi:hypothetical protein